MSTFSPVNFNAHLQSLILDSHHPPESERKLMRDVFDCCRYYQGLKPRLASQTSPFIVLDGVIPVMYRGVEYYIPILIHVGRNYPDEAPVPYVKPTQSMVIRDGHRHVDKTGRVNIPFYLNNWVHPQYSLYGLVVAMIRIFSQNPPVHSKPKTPASNSSASSNSASASSGTNASAANGANHNGYNYQQARPQQPSSYYPPQRPQQQQQQQGGHSSYGSGGSNRDDEAEKRELVKRLTKKLVERFNESQVDMTEQLVKTSVANENTKDSIAQLRPKAESMTQDVENLKQTLEEVEKQERSLQAWKERNSDVVTEEQAGDIDQLLQFHDMSTQQIAQCIAEDYAIGDTMDQVDEAFVKNIISHDKYIREIRTLSRKQFYPRALKQKLEQQFNQPHNQQQQQQQQQLQQQQQRNRTHQNLNNRQVVEHSA